MQFKDHSNYQVFALPLELEPITMVYEQLKRNSPTKRILLLCGLNDIQTCNPDVISSLTALHLWVRQSKGIVIVAASSSFLAVKYTSRKEMKSKIRDLFESMSEINASLIESNPNLRSTTALFLALHFKRPIAEFRLTAIVGSTLFPMLCKLIYLDSNNITVNPSVIEETIYNIIIHKIGCEK